MIPRSQREHTTNYPFSPCQIHEAQRARQPEPLLHRPRAHWRDFREGMFRHAWRATKETGGPLDDAARGFFEGVVGGCGRFAEERCVRGALEELSRARGVYANLSKRDYLRGWVCERSESSFLRKVRR